MERIGMEMLGMDGVGRGMPEVERMGTTIVAGTSTATEEVV